MSKKSYNQLMHILPQKIHSTVLENSRKLKDAYPGKKVGRYNAQYCDTSKEHAGLLFDRRYHGMGPCHIYIHHHTLYIMELAPRPPRVMIE